MMENNNKKSKNENKKLIIVCATIVLVAAVALVGVMTLKNGGANQEMALYDDLSSYEMSYDDFTYGVKEDISKEQEAQIKDLYDKYLAAVKEKDDKAIMDVFTELDNLGVFDQEMIGSMDMGEISPEEWEAMDPDGDGVVYFDEEGNVIDENDIVGGN